MQSATPKVLLPSVWPLPVSLAATSGISVDFSSSAYLDVSVQRVYLHIAIWFTMQYWSIAPVGFPIRKSTDRWIFAPPRGLSQLVTSFFGSWCQGIRRMLLLAWPRHNSPSSLRPALVHNFISSVGCSSFPKNSTVSPFSGALVFGCPTNLNDLSFSLSFYIFHYVSKSCKVFRYQCVFNTF